jgi:hypothetical protein
MAVWFQMPEGHVTQIAGEPYGKIQKELQTVTR